MGDGVRNKGRRSCTGRLQTTTGGDDRHHVRAQPRPASEKTTHDDTVRPAATHTPGGVGHTPEAQGEGSVRPGSLPRLERPGALDTAQQTEKDRRAAGEQDSEKKQRDLVSLNPEEEQG